MPDRGRSHTSLQVQLSVRRGGDAIAFYREAFGATEVYRFDSDVGEAVAQLAVGDSLFWVEDESPEHHNFSPESLCGATERLLLVVDDPEAVVEHSITAGALLVHPVEEAHCWLLRRVVDPFGHHWEIGKPLSAWPPELRDEGARM